MTGNYNLGGSSSLYYIYKERISAVLGVEANLYYNANHARDDVGVSSDWISPGVEKAEYIYIALGKIVKFKKN